MSRPRAATANSAADARGEHQVAPLRFGADANRAEAALEIAALALPVFQERQWKYGTRRRAPDVGYLAAVIGRLVSEVSRHGKRTEMGHFCVEKEDQSIRVALVLPGAPGRTQYELLGVFESTPAGAG